MAIDVRPRRSPRVIIGLVEAEFTVQQIHDQVTNWSDEPHAHAFKKLIKTSGLQDLGGGIKVGLTSEMQDAVFVFEPVYTVVEEGTITTGDSEGRFLEDSTALFETNGVEAGAFIINFTDGSVQTVLNVISETKLEMFEPLQCGTDNQFDIGDSYKVWNIGERELTGGNLVGIDSVGDPLTPILATFGVMVTRTSSSSATLAEVEALQAASFGGQVVLDLINGSTVPDYPTGTYERPAGTKELAKTIANNRGIKTIKVLGDVTFVGTSDNFTGFTIIGESPSLTTITIETTAIMNSCGFRHATVTGVLDSGAYLEECALEALTYVNGEISNCMFTGNITLGGGADALVLGCKDT